MFQLEFICVQRPAACQVEPLVSTSDFDQGDVAPTELRQVIEHAAALDSTADHQHLRFRSHR